MELLIKKSFKYRIYPTRSQISTLENQFSMCRHLYNWSLAERIEVYLQDETTISYNQQQNNLPALKEERPWFKSVHSQVLQDVLRRLDNGYQAFFRRIKNGETPGFPRFKKRGQWDSITFPQYQKHPVGSSVFVSKVGKIKIVYHREIPGDAKIKILIITKDAGKWFACFSVEFSIVMEPKQDLLPPVGIDMGLIDFFYASDGSKVSIPKYLRKKEKQLQRLQRRLSKAKKGTKKYRKILKALQKCHYRVKCQR
ncbi:MAG: transposase, partial [Desulfobacterium sp.]